MASPSWYDILGVSRDATPEQIKQAWRAATDKFEPGSGTSQFRLFNEGADVLLDPAKRARYDAELDGRSAAPTPSGSAPQGTGAIADAGPGRGSAEAAPATASLAEPSAEPAPENAADGEGLPDTGATGQATAETKTAKADVGLRVPWWALLVLAVLTLALLVVGGIFALDNRDYSHKQQAGVEAVAAAENAMTVVLSYDYRHLPTDRNEAAQFLSPRYSKEYLRTFDKLIEGSNGSPGAAVQAKAVVKATVQGSAVVDASPNLVRVLLFVDQSTSKNGGQPVPAYNRVVATMTRSGNHWLVDNLQSF